MVCKIHIFGVCKKWKCPSDVPVIRCVVFIVSQELVTGDYLNLPVFLTIYNSVALFRHYFNDNATRVSEVEHIRKYASQIIDQPDWKSTPTLHKFTGNNT